MKLKGVLSSLCAFPKKVVYVFCGGIRFMWEYKYSYGYEVNSPRVRLVQAQHEMYIGTAHTFNF
jgi:hypothetical protein